MAAVGQGVAEGAHPERVRRVITLRDGGPCSLVRAAVAGDVRGWAEITIADTDAGCEARLVSELAPASALLRTLAVVARPAVRFGHDWVLDCGAEQLRTHALAAPAPISEAGSQQAT